MTVPSVLDMRVTELSAQHPNWDFWYVRLYVGGVVWCARPRWCEDGRHTLNADSPEHLSEKITEVEDGQRAAPRICPGG